MGSARLTMRRLPIPTIILKALCTQADTIQLDLQTSNSLHDRCCTALNIARGEWSSKVCPPARTPAAWAAYLPSMVAHARCAEADAADVSARESQRRPQGGQLRNGATQAVTNDDNALWRAAIGQFQQRRGPDSSLGHCGSALRAAASRSLHCAAQISAWMRHARTLVMI